MCQVLVQPVVPLEVAVAPTASASPLGGVIEDIPPHPETATYATIRSCSGGVNDVCATETPAEVPVDTAATDQSLALVTYSYPPEISAQTASLFPEVPLAEGKVNVSEVPVLFTMYAS